MGRPLGQHFLAAPAILDRIVDALEPDPNDIVIEIGPGRGTLTRRLAPRVGQVIAIEKDRRLAELLRGTGKRERGRVGAENVRVIEGDALGLRWHEFVMERPLPPSPFSLPHTPSPVARFKVIGNIPYYITTPLIEKALSHPTPALVVFLVQKEVADRLAAAPGSRVYGALSAGVQAIASVERLFVVKRGAFRPPPKVDSALVRLRPLREPLVDLEEREAWRRFLSRLFSQRRKQLGGSLRTLFNLNKESVEATLLDLDVEPETRAELLAPQTLVRLFHAAAR